MLTSLTIQFPVDPRLLLLLLTPRQNLFRLHIIFLKEELFFINERNNHTYYLSES